MRCVENLNPHARQVIAGQLVHVCRWCLDQFGNDLIGDAKLILEDAGRLHGPGLRVLILGVVIVSNAVNADYRSLRHYPLNAACEDYEARWNTMRVGFNDGAELPLMDQSSELECLFDITTETVEAYPDDLVSDILRERPRIGQKAIVIARMNLTRDFQQVAIPERNRGISKAGGCGCLSWYGFGYLGSSATDGLDDSNDDQDFRGTRPKAATARC